MPNPTPDDIIARCPGCRVEFRAADLAGKDACPVCGSNLRPGQGPSPANSATATVFRNPANGHTEDIGGCWAWVLLLGCIYFAAKGVWTHAVAALLAAIVTGGLSWLVYPFFAARIMRTHYLRKGWVAAA